MTPAIESDKQFIAFFLNSPTLGGAERSMLEQIHLMTGFPRNQIRPMVFIPLLAGNSPGRDIEEICQKYELPFRYFYYNPHLFEFSRSGQGNLSGLLNVPVYLLETLLELRKLRIPDSSIIWCNGNKVGLIWLLYRLFFLCTIQTVWHFRDYPEEKPPFRFLWPLIGRISRYWRNHHFIANSHSVASSMTQAFRGNSVMVAYNPVGHLKSRPLSWQTGNIILGSASMLAPWKGVLDVVETVLLYATQLKQLGVKELQIYGDNPYHTHGEHSSYPNKIVALIEKSKAKCEIPIILKGRASPSEIFSNIHILIHAAKRPEPFGRILAEAFNSHVLVVTTGLGGAGEIAHHETNCLHFNPGDPYALFSALERLLSSEDLRDQLKTKAAFDGKLIEERATRDLQFILQQILSNKIS